ncbi:MAG: tryptophan synthase subunit alpha [Planctomycetales bacterium]|nr:tryptophan synthase subunit alpha [Planctomycetales bacterium]
MVSTISSTFDRLRSAGHMAFMPFLTAGDPDLPTMCRLIRERAARGVDLIEIGFPYSDPIADGPVIQASYTRALGHKLHVDDIFAAIQSLTSSIGNRQSAIGNPPLPPLVAMVSYALIFRRGAAEFAAKARDAGFAGLIVPDLPADEATDLVAIARQHGLDLIQLIAPTTTADRTRRILDSATGFLYCISVAGTTGERVQLPDALKSQLRSLRQQTTLPLAVGFGVSRPEQVAELRGLADGVIVGSAIVRQVAAISERNQPVDAVVKSVGDFAASMLAETRL